jgi:alkaline phosphatase D
VNRRPVVDRRAFVQGTLGAAIAAAVAPFGRVYGQAPGIVRSESASPIVTHGIAAGDVHGGRAVVWSRADRPSRLFVEYSSTENFAKAPRIAGPAALDASDFTARVVLTDLPPGQRVFYRVTFQDLGDLRAFSRPVAGSFLTPSTSPDRDVTIAFSADTVGQGWGINPDWGGLRLYETIRRAQPDVFINLGDTIYADQPVEPEVKLDDGTIWKNVVTEGKSKPAQSVDEFRGAYQYNLLDELMRRFNAEVPQIVMWDDHEVRDNWYHTKDIRNDKRYTEKSVALLAARAQQAFREYNPLPLNGDDSERIYRTVSLGPLAEVFVLDLRSYRGANSPNRQAALDASSALMGVDG